MTDENVPNSVAVLKVTALIGDGVGTHFSVDHPDAPNVVASLYRTLGGEAVLNLPIRESGRVVYAFAHPPKDQEFIAVVIG